MNASWLKVVLDFFSHNWQYKYYLDYYTVLLYVYEMLKSKGKHFRIMRKHWTNILRYLLFSRDEYVTIIHILNHGLCANNMIKYIINILI